MKEMLLLGAGASVEAGVPDSYGMTQAISARFREDRALQTQAHIISFIVGGLLFQQGVRGDDPLESGVNVEELFNAVLLLSERTTLEAAPFVGSWHSMVQKFDTHAQDAPNPDRLLRIIFEDVKKQIINAWPSSAPGFGSRDIDRELEKTIKRTVEAMLKSKGSSSVTSSATVGREIGDYVTEVVQRWIDNLKSRSSGSGSAFEREFEKAIKAAKEEPGGGEVFQQTAELMIRALTDLVWIDKPERVQHLIPILNLVASQGVTTVATLNYDNGLELLAASNSIRCETGIDQWSATGAFDPPPNGIFLLKLHGSIDWALHRNRRSAERPMPHSIIQRTDVSAIRSSRGGHRPAVVFGQRNKLTAEGPFLDLLRAFQRELSTTDLLTIVGYSFRDLHINQYISGWLNADKERRIRVIAPDFVKRCSTYSEQLLSFCRGRIEVIDATAGVGLASVFPALKTSVDIPAELTPTVPNEAVPAPLGSSEG
jgi:hypothetical protein